VTNDFLKQEQYN